MAPILIDKSGLLKLGFISALTTVLIFVSGFFLGYDRAITLYQTDNEVAALSLPEKVASVEGEIAPQIPGIIEAGAEIDVDHPEAEARTSIKSANPDVSQQQNQAMADDKSATKNVSAATQLTGYTNVQVVKFKPTVHENSELNTSSYLPELKGIKKSSAAKLAGASSLNDIAATKTQTVNTAAFTFDELNTIKYTVQVGVYGQLINAENLTKRLQKQQLNAYVSDYTNKNNEIRYNVRFGCFVDKKTAVVALKEYKNKQKGDGYLVRFSDKNIVNFAGVESVKKFDSIEKTDHNLLLEKSPSEISHAELLNNSSTISKAITN